jgi:hypothetical protein
MNKLFVLVPIVAALAACSSTRPSDEVKNMGFNASKERQASGNTVFKDENGVRVEVDDKGNWVSIRAVGYSTYVTDDSHDKLTAIQIASSRARAAISNYIDSQVRTETSISKQTKSVVGMYITDKTTSGIKAGNDNLNDPRQVGDGASDSTGGREREESRKVVVTSSERTNTSSANLLRGTTVLAQGFNQGEKTAWVEVGISRVSLQSSKQIKRDISAGLKE